MTNWVLTFLVLALLAGALGLFGLEMIASQIAWLLFVVFVALFVISLALGRRSPPLDT